MNIVLLCGRVASDPVVRTLPDGTTSWSFDVVTAPAPAPAPAPATATTGRAGTASSSGSSVSVPIVWSVDDRPSGFTVDTAVIVAGVVRKRFYRAGGVTQARTEVAARFLAEVGAKGPGVRIWRQLWASIGDDEMATLRSGLGALPGAST